MGRTPISLSIQKKLYSESAGMCNLCKKRVNELNVVAHIIAYSPHGPRGDTACDAEFINSYENLILLCPTCHREVDADPDKFTADFLINQKQRHISYIDDQLDQKSARRNSDVFCIRKFIECGDLNNLAGYIRFLPNSFDTHFVNLPSFIDDLLSDIPSALPFYDFELESYFKRFYDSYRELCDVLNGKNDNLKHGYENLPPL